MLNKEELLDLGYEINEDPVLPGRFYWIANGNASAISLDTEDEAIFEASQSAKRMLGDLHRCDNCGKIHTDETLKLAKHLGERVDSSGPMPSGECSECGALCYPIEPDPDWEDVMSHFGLDPSFMYTTKHIMDYTRQYIEGVANERKVRTGEMAIKLLEEADSYLREIRAENLDGSEPELGKLLERLTGFWLDVDMTVTNSRGGKVITVPGNLEKEVKSGMRVSLDGGVTYQNASNGVRLVYKDMPIPGDGYEAGELHVNATHEGLILDVLATRVGMVLDENIGTSSQMAADIVARMVEVNND